MADEAEVEVKPVENSAVKGVAGNAILLGIIALIGWACDLWKSAAISVAVNFFVFAIHAGPQRSEKFFDATGTLTYLTLIISALFLSDSFNGFDNMNFDIRQIVLSAMVCVWAVRLGSYLLGRICKDGKDHRFDSVKASSPILFLGVWSYQALWCFLVALPVLIIVSFPCGGVPSVWDIAGWALWVFGFGFEVISDRQKDAFRRDPANKGRFISVGLWAYSRHPNYFGEITLWIGICVSGMSCYTQGSAVYYLAWLSPLTTFLLLNYVSGVPLLEKTGEERWGTEPAYQHYVRNTPCVIPRFTAPPPFKAEEVALTA